MVLDEVGYRSADLAREIRRQLGTHDGYVDIEQIAYALDIAEIKLAPLTSFEGALLTDAERSCGLILANNSKGKHRTRFTIAHELLHFLNDRHIQTAEGFRCRSKDIGQGKTSSNSCNSKHQRQEAEANEFAIEILAPEISFVPYLSAPPDLEHVSKVAKNLELSKEATARRYRNLHEANTAVVFHQNGALRYFDKSSEFPFLPIRPKAPLPNSVQRDLPAGTLTDMLEADPKDWFDGPPGGELFAQTLYQSDGVAMTLLALDGDFPCTDDDKEDGLPELGMPTFR